MMKPLSPEQITAKLFTEPGPRPVATGRASDPLVETPMQVTLDQLRPYEHNPRFIRNPLYDELKASIRERGLDQPPPITRRPGAPHFVIRNGGNTRLAILNELWQETRNERFFRIHCLYRPWDGELSALLGHLAENDLHGQLTFIERALSVVKAKQMLEEDGEPLSQRELSRQLAAGGYSVNQSNISRMFDTLEHLLPAIPQALYQGLGRRQIERLISLRSQALQLWIDGNESPDAFSVIWLEALAKRDTSAVPLDVDLVEHDIWAHLGSVLRKPAPKDGLKTAARPDTQPTDQHSSPSQPINLTGQPSNAEEQTPSASDDTTQAPPTSRVAQIHQLVADARLPADGLVESPLPSAEAAWHIDDTVVDQAELRQLIAQQARQLLVLSGSSTLVHASNSGLGFTLEAGADTTTAPVSTSATLLLSALSLRPEEMDGPEQDLLPLALFGHVLIGLHDLDPTEQSTQNIGLARLPDDALLSLIRLIRLARTLVDLIKETAH